MYQEKDNDSGWDSPILSELEGDPRFTSPEVQEEIDNWRQQMGWDDEEAEGEYEDD